MSQRAREHSPLAVAIRPPPVWPATIDFLLVVKLILARERRTTMRNDSIWLARRRLETEIFADSIRRSSDTRSPTANETEGAFASACPRADRPNSFAK